MTDIKGCFGLTGGMGAGKTTVSRVLLKHGVQIIDADMLTRLVHRDERVIAQLVAAFGPGVWDTASGNPQISRSRLGAAAFSHPSGIEKLNQIMHPALFDEAKVQLARASKPVVLDAALLFEAGWDSLVSETIAVLCPMSVRLARISARDGLCETQVRARMAAQMSDETRCQKADIIIYNTGSFLQLERQTQIIFEKKLAKHISGVYMPRVRGNG